MWENFWNIIGLVGFFSFLFFSTLSFVRGTFLKKKIKLYITLAIISFLIFGLSVILFPGEEEVAEEIGNPERIYERGVQQEKIGNFQMAKKDYQIALKLEPQNEKTINKLEFLERREIAITFLEAAKKLLRRNDPALAKVKLEVAKKIAPPTGSLEDSLELYQRIKKELEIAERMINEKQ